MIRTHDVVIVGGGLVGASLAIALDRDEQLFHFGLARAYLRLGQFHLADSELVRAHDLSSGGEQARYQAKLDALRRMRR